MLKNPANRHKAVGLNLDQWHYGTTNTFSEEESRALYERYAIPASGRIFWESALATIQPGRQDSWVDYHNDNRAPLLFLSGGEDHLMPPSVQRSNAKHQVPDRHRGQGVPATPSHAGPARLGGDRGLRARVVARARPATSAGLIRAW